MSRSLVLAAGCVALFLVADSPAQPPGGFGGPPGGYGGDRGDRGRGGFSRDPDERFNQLSGGKDVVVIDQITDERSKFFVNMMAQRMGITNGRITREQYKGAMESFRSRMGGGPGGPPGATTSITIQGGPSSGGFGRGGGPMTPEQIDRSAEDYMRRHDKNGDGLLQVTEMSDRLRPVWEKYDTNKDGAISLDEVKGYLRDRDQTRQQESSSASPATPARPGEQPAAGPDGLPPVPDATPVQEEDARPTLYRFGKLPKELPAWFAELDTDKDGQVGLYEWVSGGRSVDEFKLMDRNDDGLLTIEEVLGYVRNSKSSGSVATASAGGPGDRSNGEVRFQFGGGPPGMRPDGSDGRGRFGGDFRGRFGGPPGMRPDGSDGRSRFGGDGRSPRPDGGDFRSRGDGSGRDSYRGRGPGRGSSDRANAPDAGDYEPREKIKKKDRP